MVRASLAPHREHFSRGRISDRQTARSAQARHFEAIHGSRCSAIAALDLKRAAEANQIGGGTSVFCGHTAAIRLAERFVNTARLLYSDFRLRAAPAGGCPAQRRREATGRAEHPIGGQPRFYAGAALSLVYRPPVKADAPDVANTLLVMMPPGMMSVTGGKRTQGLPVGLFKFQKRTSDRYESSC